MSSNEARLAAFAQGWRLLRLRHTVKNRDNVSCDACGSMEPQLLHLVKDEGANQYFFAGSNCLQSLVELAVIRQRYATDVAGDVYKQELARRHAAWENSERAPELQGADSTSSSPSVPGAAGDSAVVVAAVAVLQPDEWAALVEALPLGTDRWRLIALGSYTWSIANLLGVDTTVEPSL